MSNFMENVKNIVTLKPIIKFLSLDFLKPLVSPEETLNNANDLDLENILKKQSTPPTQISLKEKSQTPKKQIGNFKDKNLSQQTDIHPSKNENKIILSSNQVEKNLPKTTKTVNKIKKTELLDRLSNPKELDKIKAELNETKLKLKSDLKPSTTKASQIKEQKNAIKNSKKSARGI